MLPSNPFSLGLSPLDHFVTGSFSLRSVRDGANYVTAMSVTLSNGDAAPVAVHPAYHWEFWDGPVGSGTLVEQGNGAFPGGDITVAGHSTWGGWIVFTSPPGSGVFGKLDSKEDLGFNLTMNRVVGGAVNDEITARTMFRFGLNQDTEPQTLEQLGGRFGVTKERIRQLEARALGKLRKIALEEKLDIPGI